MLVLSRRQGESIVIGGEIVVTVIEVRGGQVRLGIDAPRSIDVHREEIYRQVVQENLAAVESASGDPSLLRKVGDPRRQASRPSEAGGGGEAGPPSEE